MKRLQLAILAMTFAVGLAAAVYAEGEKFAAKVGDSIYVCACGAACKCGTLSSSEGSCGCGRNMVKATVSKVDAERVYYSVEGKELSAPIMGEYRCDCGNCRCNAVSQKPGRCGCGGKMIKVQ